MKKYFTRPSAIKNALYLAVAVTSFMAAIYGCNKAKAPTAAAPAAAIAKSANSLTRTMTVATIRASYAGAAARVMFNENEQILNVYDAATLAVLQDAQAHSAPVSVTYDPWQATVQLVAKAGGAAQRYAHVDGTPTARKIDLATMQAATLDNVSPAALGILNTASGAGLTSVIPDFATAQAMFDYITHQCCALSGPYTVDFCISFQYCEDGCYARAHKMCWIMNNKYHYATQKIFSFANAGNDELCVKAEKWGGCCVNWWYHVAPLVTVQTPSGPKAYVFDPAMFDQPVLLSQWLHAQENPACVPTGDVPHVSMINVQPTASYWPSGGSGMYFGTDPMYSSTDSTMVDYAPLSTCH